MAAQKDEGSKQSNLIRPENKGDSKLITLPTAPLEPQKIAVLLNRNARRVTDRLARKIERIVGSDHVFYSRSLDEAEAFSREIVQRGYGTVVCGGGDGTLINAVNMIHRYVREANLWRNERFSRFGESQPLLTPPRFAFLKLGTGNGMTNLVGASKPIEDVKRIVDYVPGRIHPIPLIEMEGEYFFFSGMGYDSLILEDYNWLKKHARNFLLKRIMQNVLGYVAASFGRTIPRLISGEAGSIDARVVTRGKAYYIDPRRGDAVEEIAPGEVLFEGKSRFLGAATTPFYGYGLKIFPFARMMPGMMHLRIANTGIAAGLINFPSIWKGNYRSANKVFDFFVEDISVELAKPYTFQHSGDAQGPRDHLDLRIAENVLNLVDLHPPRRLA